MLSTPSPSAPLLVLLLPSLWAAPPKQIVSPLRHLVDRCLSNIGATNGFVVANSMSNATEAILGVYVLSVDLAASVVCGFVIAIPMGDATKV
jgi:predicted P-loop ATPase/GTPase